jgi:hypothetical protein
LLQNYAPFKRDPNIKTSKYLGTYLVFFCPQTRAPADRMEPAPKQGIRSHTEKRDRTLGSNIGSGEETLISSCRLSRKSATAVPGPISSMWVVVGLGAECVQAEREGGGGGRGGECSYVINYHSLCVFFRGLLFWSWGSLLRHRRAVRFSVQQTHFFNFIAIFFISHRWWWCVTTYPTRRVSKISERVQPSCTYLPR